MTEANFTHLNQYYIAGMRPIIRKHALYSDVSDNYISPAQPAAFEKVKIRFRSATNNIDKVYLVSRGEKHIMEISARDELFDYYTTEVQLDDAPFAYYFEVHVGNLTVLFDTRGVVRNLDEHFKFKLIPGFNTPKWAVGAVMYQIFVDRFCNGDPTNDVQTDEFSYIGEHCVQVHDWDKLPDAMGVREFYGGDLQGVLDKMDYLEQLGIEVIYFNPLFVSPSNHKYDIQDYDYIDPHFGRIVDERGDLLAPGDNDNQHATRYINRVTNKANLEASNELFAKVVAEAHRRGIRVILDGVFNHCGSFNKWMDHEGIYLGKAGFQPGAFQSIHSPYRSYFHFNDSGNGRSPMYEGWWGYSTLPKLNYEDSPGLCEEIYKIAEKWLSPPYCIDGWRLDVASDLGHSPEYNHKFWQGFRARVKAVNPDALIIAEHYGDPSPWLNGREWDSIMNYDAFMEPVTWFLTGMEKHSDSYRDDLYQNGSAFFGIMKDKMSRFKYPSLLCAMNELSNHDHSRFLTRTNRMIGRITTLGSGAASAGINKGVFREAVTIQMTWPGAPTVYYADEAGQVGWTDPDNRRTYPWGHEDQSLIDLHRDLIRLRHTLPVLKNGSIKPLLADYGRIAYARFNNESRCVIAVNNTGNLTDFRLHVRDAGAPDGETFRCCVQTGQDGHQASSEVWGKVTDGFLTFNLPPFSSIVLCNAAEA